ncbi:serine/arginine repetitive matrix protein 1-like [Lytechinus variegatus]|uniref:serine/arginine repetitive matrix protein 1-like n=1 Tax=Lytechinus variegatus TaxID=7654 RepID=UPI001BB214CD|nr:serine/arginine repetitive matrix protein 1-like [Lytechinus variegatus]
MAFWKRRSQSFEPVSPQSRYTVTYLGYEEMQGKVGLDNTLKPVDDMYRQYKSHKSKTVSKMQIEVINNGIKVEPLDAGVKTMFANSPYFVGEGPFGSVFFPINKLSFGAADPYHNKIFCFVSRNENPADDHFWDCHAVFCESSAMAKNLTLNLVKAFQKINSGKEDPLVLAQKSQKPTTVHILRERGTSEHQLQARRKKRPPVSTVSVTLNVGEKTDLGDKDTSNCNRAVADIIAQRAKMELGTGDSDVSNGNSVSKGVGTSSSDKENDLMEGILSDEDMTRSNSLREVEVTVALNPDLNSPLESPQKSTSPRGDRISSGEEDDAVFTLDPRSGEMSPKEMITTMSPPDTPSYLSKEGKLPSPTLSYTPTKSSSPSQQRNSGKVKAPSSPQASVIPGNISPRKLNSSEISKRTKAPSPPKSTTPDSPRQLNTVQGDNSRQQVTPKSTTFQKIKSTSPTENLRRNTPSPISPKTSPNPLPGSPRSVPSPASTPPLKASPPKKENEGSGITTPEVTLRRRSPQSTLTSGASPDDSGAVQKKSRKERKSVRFAVEEVHIG